MGTKTGKTIKHIHFSTRSSKAICNSYKITWDVTDNYDHVTCPDCISILKARGSMTNNEPAKIVKPVKPNMEKLKEYWGKKNEKFI